MVNEDAPKISLDVDFESNHAFFFALFVLLCAMGWAIRDHRRRNLEVMVAQAEDRLYMGVLSILFAICIFGSYYAFRRQVSGRLQDLTTQPVLQRRIEEAVAEKIRDAELEEAEMETDPVRIAFVLAGGTAIAGVFLFILWFVAKRGAGPQMQAEFAPKDQGTSQQAPRPATNLVHPTSVPPSATKATHSGSGSSGPGSNTNSQATGQTGSKPGSQQGSGSGPPGSQQ